MKKIEEFSSYYEEIDPFEVEKLQENSKEMFG